MNVSDEPRMVIEVEVNGRPRRWKVAPDEPLTDVLRREGLTSVKKGCGEGTCGSCTVLLDDNAVASCITLAAQAHGRRVTTVEGLGTPSQPHPLQLALVRVGAVQCGFCTPGVVLAAAALLARRPDPTDAQVREALDGNLCRCTGYVKIVEGVQLAARWLRAGTSAGEEVAP